MLLGGSYVADTFYDIYVAWVKAVVLASGAACLLPRTLCEHCRLLGAWGRGACAA